MGIPKKKDEETFNDLPQDRELKLAKDFSDPSLEELIPGLSGSSSLLQDTAEAVQELVTEAVPDVLAASPSEAEMARELFELVACEKNFSQMCDSVLGALMKGCDASAGSMLELDYDKQEFFFRASQGGGSLESLQSFRIPHSQGIVGQVATTGEAMCLGADEADAKQLRAISMTTGFDIHGCVAVPLLVAGQLFGVIELFNRTQGAFDDNSLESAKRGARMAGKVLEVRFLLSALAKRKVG